MKLDLTALADFTDDSKGKPFELPISKVMEDSNQPRKAFDEDSLRELAASIKERGVKTPISVHDNPARPGQYIINHGTRRLRASILAGKTTIPAFIDEVYDGYDQVTENVQRENLTPMELAMFIQKRIDAGDTKGNIARRLGKAASVISFHLALIDPPACIEDAYASGKCMSPKTLYELRVLHEKFPAQVDAWYSGEPDITRRAVAELTEKFCHDKKLELGADRRHGNADVIKDAMASNPPPLEGEAIEKFGQDQKIKQLDGSPFPNLAETANLTAIKKAPAAVVVLVKHNGRMAAVMPRSMVKIIYQDSDEVAEVYLDDVQIVSRKARPT